MSSTSATGAVAPSQDVPRPTPTQAFRELAMAYATRQASAPEQSVELTRNARGIVQISVTTRSESLMMASDVAQAEFEALCAKYPYPVSNGGSE